MPYERPTEVKPTSPTPGSGAPPASTPATPKAHECLDHDDKGLCSINAGVEVIQAGEETKRKFVATVNRIQAIDHQRDGDVGNNDSTASILPDVGAIVNGNLAGRSHEELVQMAQAFIVLVLAISALGAALVLFRRRK